MNMIVNGNLSLVFFSYNHLILILNIILITHPVCLLKINVEVYLIIYPLGWYRHALNVVDKYPNDKLWLRKDNVDGEWPVAFHGTHGGAVKGITKQGLLITKADAMRKEAVDQKGEDFDKPGLYVATHCDGGAHPAYTKKFTVQSTKEKIETFRVVFQCRVKPDAYTVHTSPVSKGEAWRFVDPEAIRPTEF